MPLTGVSHFRSDGIGHMILEIDSVWLEFGGIAALSDIHFSVEEGKISSIIGPNGAGKTSLFNCITGIYKPNRGSIRFNGKELLGLRPHQISNFGIARTFQNVELFNRLTVLDNLLLGRHNSIGSNFLMSGIFWGKARQEEIKNRRRVEEIIDFLEMEKWSKHMVGNLPYGIQKRTELGRALSMDPKLLLIDEVTSGMNVEETEDIARFILDIKEEMEITIVLVEHDMRVVMDISDRIMVLDFGKKIAEGSPQEVAKDPEVIRSYLGSQQGG